ncbi:GlcG/HbpS family heme-binding protein [Enteractinococcus helveticum]|uniref:GlcG/HbpS family heme-binding protein n=1 Tax=Enteractinococcus helveticum TaxID=1837282 RepID=UPI000A80F528
MTSNPSTITLQQAQTVVDACLRRAAELDLKMNVAVVDAGANLKAFGRMDDAWLGSIDISIKKARTARYFDCQPAICRPWCSRANRCITWNFPTADSSRFPVASR